jgi:DNA-binding MarR family transcriptional regulator
MKTPTDRNGEAGAGVQSAPDRVVSDARLEQFTGYLMKRAFNLVQSDLARVLEPFGLRMLSFSTLMVVIDNPDITQTQLAQALSVERSNIVVVLDVLEEAGLLNRNPVPRNRRAYALRATLAGQRLADKASKAVAEHEARLFGWLSPREHAILRGALTGLASAPD